MDTAVGMAANSFAITDQNAFAATYRAWRRAYYDRFPEFWGTLPGSSVEEYAIYGALAVPRQHARALRLASTRLYQLLTRLAFVLQHAEDQALLAIGIPVAAIPYVHTVIPAMPAVMCGRFEFAMTATGPRLLEFNAETPTFVVELFHMNGQVCADFGLIDPNRDCQQQLLASLQTSLAAGIAWVEPRPDPPMVAFSAYADRKEERGTTEFYRALLEANGAASYQTGFRSLDELRVARDGLRTVAGERVDVLYKLYPTEHLMLDETTDGVPVGLLLMDLVRKRRLAVINPPVAFVLQNKALLAVLWALHLAKDALFTLEEHRWIDRYVLPTYLETHDARGQSLFEGLYVVKPVYGREGISISIRQGDEIIAQNEQHLYDAQMMVYQQFIALPTTTIQTEVGPSHVHLVHNCFIAGGVASAIGVRASSQQIFDDTSYFVPVCYAQKS